MKKAQWIYTTIHEMTHSLVFSPFHFKKFLKEPNPVVKQGKYTYVNSPSIKKHVQDHFNCDSAPGAPLEDEVLFI